MSIERVGQFIEFVADEGGTRTLARVSAIQIVAETDPIGQETFITVANRTFRVGVTIDKMREVLADFRSPDMTRGRHR